MSVKTLDRATPANRLSKRQLIKSMKAVRLHQYGGPEVLKFEGAPCAQPAAGELLFRVHAAAVNPVDWKVTS